MVDIARLVALEIVAIDMLIESIVHFRGYLLLFFTIFIAISYEACLDACIS